MSRIRTIKPEFFRSLDVAELSHFQQLLWIGLWTEADDHGRLVDDPRLIKAALFPLDNGVHLPHVENGLSALALRGRIQRYAVDGREYLLISNWHKHQAINRPGKPKYPGPAVPVGPVDPAADGYCRVCAGQGSPVPTASPLPRGARTEPSRTTHGAFTEDSVNAHGGLTPGREGNREGNREGSAREDRAGPTRAATALPASRLQGPPPSKCPKHEHDPAPPACRACGDARRAHDAWVREHPPGRSTAPTPVPEAPPCTRHPEQGSSRHCPACDAEAVPAPSNIRALLAPGSDRGLIA